MLTKDSLVQVIVNGVPTFISIKNLVKEALNSEDDKVDLDDLVHKFLVQANGVDNEILLDANDVDEVVTRLFSIKVNGDDNRILIDGVAATMLLQTNGNRQISLSPDALVLMQNGGNVGVGTTEPTEKLEVEGNVKASAIVLSSPNGTKYKVAVDNDGNLISTSL